MLTADFKENFTTLNVLFQKNIVEYILFTPFSMAIFSGILSVFEMKQVGWQNILKVTAQ